MDCQSWRTACGGSSRARSIAGSFIGRAGDSYFKAEVELTIRGITRPVILDVAYLGQWETPFWVGEENRGTLRRIGFEAATRIDRHDRGAEDPPSEVQAGRPEAP